MPPREGHPAHARGTQRVRPLHLPACRAQQAQISLPLSSPRSCIAPAACSCAHAKPKAIFAPGTRVFAAVETLLLHPRHGDRGAEGAWPRGATFGALHPKQPLAQAPPAALQTPAPRAPRDAGTNGAPVGWLTALERSRTRNTSPKRKITFQLCHPSQCQRDDAREGAQPRAATSSSPARAGDSTVTAAQGGIFFAFPAGHTLLPGLCTPQRSPASFPQEKFSIPTGRGGADFAIPSLRALGKRHVFTGAG